MEERPVTLITNLWKYGRHLVIKIPKQQAPLLEGWHGEDLQVTVVPVRLIKEGKVTANQISDEPINVLTCKNCGEKLRVRDINGPEATEFKIKHLRCELKKGGS